jgi:hypothetical protein
MWTWTRIAVGVGLAGALLLAAPTQAPAGGTIGSARGEFEVRSSATRMVEVASCEAPFEVGEYAVAPSEGVGGAAPTAPTGEAPAAPAAEAPARGGTPARGPSDKGSPAKGASPEAPVVENKGKEPSKAACGAGPSSTPVGGIHK